MDHIKEILIERLERYAEEKAAETGIDEVEVDAEYEFLGTIYFGWASVEVCFKDMPTNWDEEPETKITVNILYSEFYYYDDNNKKIML